MPRLFTDSQLQKSARELVHRSPTGSADPWGGERGCSNPCPGGWATYVSAVWETCPRLVLRAPKCICMHLSVQRSANGKQKPAPNC